MQVICDRNMLAEALHVVQRGITSRSTLPILHNILLEAADGSLVLTATDLEMTIRTQLPATIEEPGRTTAPSKYLGPMVDGLSQDEIALSSDDRDQISVTAGTSKYVVNGITASEFPVIPTVESAEEISLPQGLVREMIEQVVFAASPDESRAVLTGVLLELESNQIRFVATDTHRLAFREEPHSLELEASKSAIIPAKALREIYRLLDRDSEEPVRLAFSENQIKCVIDNNVIMCRLLEGSFPNYEKVLPDDFLREAVVDRAELEAIVNRVMIVARQSASRVLFDIQPDKMEVYARSQDVGEAREELPVKLTGDGIEIAFNGEFLVDAMAAIDADEIQLKMKEQLSPAVITTPGSTNYIYVVMPMQPLH